MRRLATVSALLLIFVTSAGAQDASHASDRPHISVTGVASAEIKADYATVTIGVTTTGPNAEDALSQNAKSSASVVADLKNLGLGSDDVETAALHLSQNFEYERDPKTNAIVKTIPKGYRAANTIRARIRDLTKTGSIISHLVADGANSILGVSFGASNHDSLDDELRAKAVKDATHRATVLAQAASAKLGRILTIEISSDPSGQGNAWSGGMADLPTRKFQPDAVSPPVPIVQGSIPVSALVMVTWELLPE